MSKPMNEAPPPDESESDSSETMNQVQAEVRERLGVLPNFFRLAPQTPEITRSLWASASFAYVDNPLPTLFKERLFVYLSRFCDVRYCIIRHAGFLLGHGHPSGDPHAPTQSAEDVIRLVTRPFPRGDEALPSLTLLKGRTQSFSPVPAPDSPQEEAVFVCAAHVFLQTPEASRCLNALQSAFDESSLQYLLVLLSFVSTTHFWAKVHTDLELEDDVEQLLATNERLAEALQNEGK